MARRSYGYNPQADIYFEQRGSMDRRPIPVDSVKLDINKFVIGVQDELKDITRQMINGTVSPQQWYDRSAGLMKLSYRASIDVARGTNQEMTEEERNRWLALLLLLLLLLNGIADGINDGTIDIDYHLVSSASLRGAAARSMFENWRLASHLQAGYMEARRVLGIAEHCEESDDRPGCVDLAALGWIPIEMVVPIGAATCRDHCKCRIQYRKRLRPLEAFIP